MLGAIIGDVVGSRFEFNNQKSKDFELFTEESRFTDDTVMTLAVAEIIQKHLYYYKTDIVNTLKKWGRAYPHAGYGGRFRRWLNSDSEEPYMSYGNGSAMRISACGFYGRSESEVKELAKLVTEVTHNHLEGLKGAEVTAMCIYYARIGKSKEFIKEYVSKYYFIDFNYQDLVKNYTFSAKCEDSVPQAIYCFLISKDFEDCLRTSVSIGGDTDTVSAISCSIAEAYYKEIDEKILSNTYKVLYNSSNCKPLDILSEYLEYKIIDDVEITEINSNTKFLLQEETVNGEPKLKWYHANSVAPLVRYFIREELRKRYILGMNYKPNYDVARNLLEENKDLALMLMAEEIDAVAWYCEMHITYYLSRPFFYENVLLKNRLMTLYDELKATDKHITPSTFGKFLLRYNDCRELSKEKLCDFMYFDNEESAIKYIKSKEKTASNLYSKIFFTDD